MCSPQDSCTERATSAPRAAAAAPSPASTARSGNADAAAWQPPHQNILQVPDTIIPYMTWHMRMRFCILVRTGSFDAPSLQPPHTHVLRLHLQQHYSITKMV